MTLRDGSKVKEYSNRSAKNTMCSIFPDMAGFVSLILPDLERQAG